MTQIRHLWKLLEVDGGIESPNAGLMKLGKMKKLTKTNQTQLMQLPDWDFSDMSKSNRFCFVKLKIV